MGLARKTFVIAPDGRITKIFDKVDVERHADEVLKAVTGKP
jgi:peroxiredoxin Q/BCP